MGKFAFFAKLFVDQGYDVIGMDFKGFGHSEGLRGFIADRDEFYEEGYQFVTKARQYYKDLYQNVPKFFSMGYSQGGAMSHGIARLLHERGETQFDGQI